MALKVPRQCGVSNSTMKKVSRKHVPDSIILELTMTVDSMRKPIDAIEPESPKIAVSAVCLAYPMDFPF